MSRRRMMTKSVQSVGSSVEYIGYATNSWANGGSWTSSNPLDVLSVAEVGDLVVVAIMFDAAEDNTWSWGGMNINEIYDGTNDRQPGAYVGYKIVEATDQNPYISGVSTGWDPVVAIASVFRGISSFVNYGLSSGISAMPNPPALTANGDLWVITGHLDDDLVSMTAPANYTLSASETVGSSNDGGSLAIAYRIETLTSDDPAVFGGGGTDDWKATTITFS